MNNIGFKNIKVFKDWQNFDFKNITLLTGTNNSGKSSVINTMQMLQENLTAKNLDELLATEFVLKANQNKYGTIRSFINNKSEDDIIAFSRIINNLTYVVKLKINEGLQPKGILDSIEIFINKNEQIFSLNMVARNSIPCVEFVIDLNFFINKFFEEYERKLELKQAIEEYEKPFVISKKIEDLKKLALEGFPDKKISYDIIMGGIKSGNPTIFLNKFKAAYENGIFDFLLLSECKSYYKFKELICQYYSSNLDNSLKLLTKDLISLASKCKWSFKRLDYTKISIIVRLLFNCKELEKEDFGSIVGGQILNNSLFGCSLAKELVSESLIQKTENINLWEEIENCLCVLMKEYSIDKKDLSMNYYNELRVNNVFLQLVSEDVSNFISTYLENTILDFNLYFENLYVSSNRFTTKRAYSFNDNTDFTNLLSQIENIKDTEKRKKINNFINVWLKEFEIADELILQPDADTGNFKAFLKKDDLNVTLADYGLGTNQLLPILFSVSLANNAESKTVVIEEPEANLHPAMQSKLADMFADAIKTFNIKIIAETHSEYLIRKLQYLVASNKSEVKPDDVVIYYFNKPNNPDVLSGETEQVKKIEIDKFGRLNKEFGKGFFDEADSIAMELFLLQQSQSN